MGTKKILVVMGTRPEVIKLAPIIAELRRRRSHFETLVCGTGQHRHMTEQMLSLFGIRLHFDLQLMTHNQSLPDFLARALHEIARVIKLAAPDLVMVQGDTITAAAAAQAAYYSGVPVAHVEAGLRSHDRGNPFPEEANRLVIDQLSELLLVPTRTAARNLGKEGFPSSRIFVTGNTVIDSLRASLKKIDSKMQCCKVPKNKKLVLLTIHRRETFGRQLRGIFRAVRETAESFPGLYFVYPVHPNPNVKGPAERMLRHPRIKLVEPLPYLQFLSLMARSDLIVTDSGGIQEEAPALNKPVLVLRKRTERKEAVLAGCARLIGTGYARVKEEFALHAGRVCGIPPCGGTALYGDGRASIRTTQALLHFFFPGKFRAPEPFACEMRLMDLNDRAREIIAAGPRPTPRKKTAPDPCGPGAN